MKHLIHTLLFQNKDGTTLKYEIFSDEKELNYHKKVREGTCQVIASKFDGEEGLFKVINIDLNVDPLFEANQPNPLTIYSDGPDRVNLDMLIQHLKKIS